jgi:hypothetical protein
MWLSTFSWILLGALLGVLAAQKRGFNVVGAALGGALLGPLAFLMFFMSGLVSSDKRKKCPFCAEFVKQEAIVCPHCQREIGNIPTAASARGQLPTKHQ